MPGSPSCSGPGPQWCAGWPGIVFARPVGRPRPGRARCPVGHEPGPASTLIDPVAISGDLTAAVDWFHPSADGHVLAYGTSTGDAARFASSTSTTGGTFPTRSPTPERVGRLATRRLGLRPTRYPDPEEVGEDEASYWRRAWWHEIGRDPHHDELLFGDLPIGRPGPTSAWHPTTGGRSSMSLGWSRVDVHLIDVRSGTRTTPEGEGGDHRARLLPRQTVARRAHHPRRFPRPRHPSPPRVKHEDWETIVPEQASVIEATATTQSGLLVASTLEGVAQLHHHRPDGSGGDAIDFGEPGSLLGLDGSDDREEAFTSFARPPALQRWTPADGLVPWSDLPGAADPDHYVVERTSYLSTDGVEIGLFLIRSADLVPGPKTSTVLTGYGGFAVTMARVVACGGGVLRRRRHVCRRRTARRVRAGRGLASGGHAGEQAAGLRRLHRRRRLAGRPGFTTRERLAVRGGSNGGLLVAAGITQRPDLCAAAHCAVPLTDMVRFRFLLAELWVPEYGDPRVEQELAWLLAYSPYHHARRRLLSRRAHHRRAGLPCRSGPRPKDGRPPPGGHRMR